MVKNNGYPTQFSSSRSSAIIGSHNKEMSLKLNFIFGKKFMIPLSSNMLSSFPHFIFVLLIFLLSHNIWDV